MIPKSVKIGAQTFDIHERTKKQDSLLSEGNYGYTRDEINLIVIDSELHISKKKVTLLHEILHAARMIFELPSPYFVSQCQKEVRKVNSTMDVSGNW